MAVRIPERGPGHTTRKTGSSGGGGGGGGASPALKFNLSSNSMYLPTVAF